MKLLVRTIEKITDVISGYLQGWLVFALMILVLLDVTSRYVLLNPLSIAEEYGGYSLVAITCIGLAYAWKTRCHVRVEFLTGSLPVVMQRWLRVCMLFLAIVFTGFVVYAGYELFRFSLMFGTRSGSWLRTPIAWPQATILIGAVLMFLQLIAEIIKQIKKHSAPIEEGE